MIKTGAFKKICSFLLSVLLLISVFCTTVQALQPETGTLQSEPLTVYASPAEYSNVTAYADDFDLEAMTAELRQYVMDYTWLAQLPNNSALRIPATQENINLLATLITNNIPEAFHFEHIQASYYTSNNMIFQLAFTYNCEAGEYFYKMHEIERAADTLLYGIADNASLTDVQKALLLHDRLALHCEYGDVYGSRLDTATIYGALVGRKPVCQGYAITYQYLLDKVGIKSNLCVSEQLNHAWNIVYIDNEAYHVDVTWDDPTDDVTGRVYHNNFLLSTQALKNGVNGSRPHDANDFETTPDSTTYDNAYWQQSHTAFQLLGDDIYYIDNTAGKLIKDSDSSIVADVNDTWYISDVGHYQVGNFARLAADTKYLYYNLAKSVYKYNPTTGTKTLYYTPVMTQNGATYYSIEGFTCQYGNLQFDLINMDSSCRFSTAYCEHDYSIQKTIIQGNCVEEGCVRNICNQCLISYDTIATDPTNHRGRTVAANNIEPTCGTPGKHYDLICSACKAILEQGAEIEPTGNHQWNDGEIVTEPTVDTEGVCLFTCTTCGATKTEAIPPVTDTPATKTYGDIDNDGKISAGDARIALRASVGLEQLDADAFAAADVDNSGTVTSADARLILRYSVGLETEWPQ